MQGARHEGPIEPNAPVWNKSAMTARPHSLRIDNIGLLCTMHGSADDPLGRVENAVVDIRGGRVLFAGAAADAPPAAATVPRLDAEGATVLPGLVDCHTHLLFAGDRADEFGMRSRGATYAEIMAAGGGIRSTMRAVRAADEAELASLALGRLVRMLHRGVTTVEVKSGYGLSAKDELKSLRAIRSAAMQHAGDVHATFLGAHVVPPEYDGDAPGYVQHLIDDVLPTVAAEKLAAFCDVFIEAGAFTTADARALLTAAKAHGLKTRVHAEQLSHQGGTRLAAELGAVSASHLEYATAEDMRAMAEAGVVAEVLSTAQVFLKSEKPIDGPGLRAAGVKMAVATDFNPGSAMSLDLHLAAGLAIVACGLTADEALLGITAHGADALALPDVGRLQNGSRGDLVILDHASPYSLVYDWGENHVSHVIKGGRVLHAPGRAYTAPTLAQGPRGPS